jgi:hypothetical protein
MFASFKFQNNKSKRAAMQFIFNVIKYPHLLAVFLFLSGFYFISNSQTHSAEIKSLAEGSDIIITGKVVAQNSVWNEDRTRIFTNVTIQVDEYLKGNNTGSRLIVSHQGGEIGEVGELYSHTPAFNNAEEVLLFIKKDNKDDTFEIYQGENGKLTILRDQNTNEKMTTWHRDVNSLKLEIRHYTQEQK